MIPQGGETGVQPANGYRSISGPQILNPGVVDTFSYLNVAFFDTENYTHTKYNCQVTIDFITFLMYSINILN